MGCDIRSVNDCGEESQTLNHTVNDWPTIYNLQYEALPGGTALLCKRMKFCCIEDGDNYVGRRL